MLQRLHLDISKVDRVLHMGCVWKVIGDADDVWGGTGDIHGSTGPTAGVLAHEYAALGARSLPVRAASGR